MEPIALPKFGSTPFIVGTEQLVQSGEFLDDEIERLGHEVGPVLYD